METVIEGAVNGFWWSSLQAKIVTVMDRAKFQNWAVQF
jgi:hypothetical protein